MEVNVTYFVEDPDDGCIESEDMEVGYGMLMIEGPPGLDQGKSAVQIEEVNGPSTDKGRGLAMEENEHVPSQTELEGVPSSSRNVEDEFDFDLDPRMPVVVASTGPAEDMEDIPVDEIDSVRVLKIGSM